MEHTLSGRNQRLITLSSWRCTSPIQGICCFQCEDVVLSKPSLAYERVGDYRRRSSDRGPRAAYKALEPTLGVLKEASGAVSETTVFMTDLANAKLKTADMKAGSKRPVRVARHVSSWAGPAVR